jgi:hypothetical protein
MEVDTKHFTTETVEPRKVKFNLPNLMRKPQTKRRQSLHVTNNARDPSKTHEGGHKKPKTSGKRVKVHDPKNMPEGKRSLS